MTCRPSNPLFSSWCLNLGIYVSLWWAALILSALPLGASAADARNCNPPSQAAKPLEQLDVSEWLDRMRAAMDENTYSGIFVVMSSSGMMSSSRVWHVCVGNRQIERLEALSGTPRIVYRQNAEVRTFSPNERVVRIESREMPRKFVRAKGISAESLAEHYVAQLSEPERVAGRSADLLMLRPRDAWRFGYRVWLDRESGLVLKWQTVAPSGRVLEQAAFSELDMDAPVSSTQIAAMMNDVVGYRVITQSRDPATLQAHGWLLPVPVEGFVLLNCTQKHRHAASGEKPQASSPEVRKTREAGVQCVYSDGLASISVFLEPYSEERHGSYQGQELRLGATHTLSGRVAGNGWVTMVGEVPLATLHRFASAIKQTAH